MGDSGDPSYIPVLVEYLYFSSALNAETNVALENALTQLVSRLPGEEAPDSFQWQPWVEWVGERPTVRAPEGYARWKGNWFSSLVEPGLGTFWYDGVKTRIRLEEVVWGGVPKDGIPDLINPPVLTAQEATYLDAFDRVFGVSINGVHRAYPLRIMNPHEMANDVVGDVPIALAY